MAEFVKERGLDPAPPPSVQGIHLQTRYSMLQLGLISGVSSLVGWLIGFTVTAVILRLRRAKKENVDKW